MVSAMREPSGDNRAVAYARVGAFRGSSWPWRSTHVRSRGAAFASLDMPPATYTSAPVADTEYCAVPVEQILPAPAALSPTEAAAVPETFFTVWTNLFDRGRLISGERVLVHGGTSGIGTTAIQLAVANGADVFATAGSDDKCDACRRLGATRAINYKREDFVQVIREETSEGVDVILDIVGGDYLPRNIECLRLNGRLIQIGLLGGSKSQLNLSAIMQRRLTLTGSTLRVRTPAEKGVIAAALQQHVWPLIESGRVRPIVSEVFPLERAADAHRALEGGGVVGKVVLEVASVPRH